MFLSECPLGEMKLVRNGEFKGLSFCDVSPDIPVLTFIGESKYRPWLSDNKDISCVIATPELAEVVPDSMGLLVSNSPRTDFYILHNQLKNIKSYCRPDFPSKISKDSSISDLAYISKNNVIIGNNVIIEEFVSIKENVIIGDNTIIRAGTKIGCPGFQYFKDGDKREGVHHLGGVIIGNDVEILLNSIVEWAIFPWDNTIIGNQCKLGSLTLIGHCTKVGDRNYINTASILCGSVTVKDDTYIAPNATIAKSTIEDNVTVSLGSVVIRNVPANSTVSGNFAVDHYKLLRFIANNFERSPKKK